MIEVAKWLFVLLVIFATIGAIPVLVVVVYLLSLFVGLCCNYSEYKEFYEEHRHERFKNLFNEEQIEQLKKTDAEYKKKIEDMDATFDEVLKNIKEVKKGKCNVKDIVKGIENIEVEENE